MAVFRRPVSRTVIELILFVLLRMRMARFCLMRLTAMRVRYVASVMIGRVVALMRATAAGVGVRVVVLMVIILV